MQGTSQPNKQEKLSSILPEDLANLLGQNEVLQRLIREGLPLTVKNYIDLNWWGDTPEELDEEEIHLLELLHQCEVSQNENSAPPLLGSREMESGNGDARNS